MLGKPLWWQCRAISSVDRQSRLFGDPDHLNVNYRWDRAGFVLFRTERLPGETLEPVLATDPYDGYANYHHGLIFLGWQWLVRRKRKIS